MTIKFYKHRVETVCNNCGQVIESNKATTISKERRRSANDLQYIDSDETVVHTCEECDAK
jgi:hypothetical protein